eukprot:CAMPEP_0169280596 /NCGR_PEP_ID=MMETSP1016-20121227/55711_1 /TAXON_ID=342587 /ORGANISM="Karlodinium micrum, Strain CCMP2283" /LENGTH=91 /DNA_ID=CAMNT_0009368971 /DNA_START=135 /DNA_END=407 /DNA_ORIENTATION=+
MMREEKRVQADRESMAADSAARAEAARAEAARAEAERVSVEAEAPARKKTAGILAAETAVKAEVEVLCRKIERETLHKVVMEQNGKSSKRH